ncbi:mitochondrial potassium channel-like [Rhynchophorus ferrugineus]|uniref:mitochondrial potassium channel-like n=1 Tax=Rhynchophorus ferrugineus TaxID=354439 RepID=UPI003FCCFE70
MHFTYTLRQIVNNQTLEALKRSITKTIAEAAPHIQAAKENQIKIVSQKLSDFNNWYMRITGLDKVNLSQEQVTALQSQLLQIQEKRREVGRQLSDIRIKSMELQDEIHKIKRQDDLEKFLDLMKKETEVLKLEKSISKTFQDYDQTERELFTAFSDSIRDSHEKQRAQMEYTKYFGIVLSVTGSFLAFVYSTLKKQQLKNIIDERLSTLSIPVTNDESINKLLQNTSRMNENILYNSDILNNISKKISESSINKDDIAEYINKSNINPKYVYIGTTIFGMWLIVVLSKAFSV